MKQYIEIILINLLFVALISCSNTPAMKSVEFGLDVLQKDQFALLKNKKVGVITNQTGLDSRGQHIADILHSAPEVEVVALFGPEHGIRGNIEGGFTVSKQIDEQTGVRMYSLCG